MKMEEKRKGISLIVLVITIVIIIILASAIILNVTKNNPMNSAKKAKFLSDMDNIKMELEMYVAKKHTDTLGEYNRELLEATKDKVFENGVEDTSKNISDILTSIDGTKYEDKIQIVEGQIVYVGKDKDEIGWAGDKGIEVTAVKINIVNNTDEVSIKGKISVTGSIVEEEKIEKYEIYVAKKGENYSNIPDQVITNKSSIVSFEIEWKNIKEEYKLKVDVTIDGKKYTKEITGKDLISPDVNQITVNLSPNVWTSSDIKVVIENIPSDAVLIQYTLPNNTEWINYSNSFLVNENGVINIRMQDLAGNESTKSIIIDKIDRIPPTMPEFVVTSTANNIKVQIIRESVDNESGLSHYNIELQDENGKILSRKENINELESTFEQLISDKKYYVKLESVDSVEDGNKNVTITEKKEIMTKQYDIKINCINQEVNIFEDDSTIFEVPMINNAIYKWYYNDKEINGATSNRYVLNTIDMNLDNYKGGIYKVEVIVDGYTKISQIEQKIKPYEIYTAKGLKNLAIMVNEKGINFDGDIINQTQDIDLSSVCGNDYGSFIGIGQVTEFGGKNSFRGTYNGNHNKITNLYINEVGNNEPTVKALFIENHGTIKNLEIQNGSIFADNCVSTCLGGIVGYNFGVVENCGNRANITVTGNRWSIDGNDGMRVSGIACINFGTVKNCYNYGNISGQNRVGGIVGDNTNYGEQYGKIYNCYNTGVIKVNDFYGGGISGVNWIGCVIENSYNIGQIIAEGIVDTTYGNITGRNVSVISNCYYLGDIPGKGAMCEDIEGATFPKSSDFMKTLEFVQLLNKGENNYKIVNEKNNGYPILNFE